MNYKILETRVKAEVKRVLPAKFQFYIGPGVLGAKWEYKNGFSQISMATTQYQPNYYIDGVSALIRFDEVELLLNDVLLQNNLNIIGIGETIRMSLHNVEGIDYNFSKIPINDDESFKKVFTEIEKIIQNGALPFFEKYHSLEKANEYIESLPVTELSAFISGYVPIKRLIIKRLCNNPDWIDYGKTILSFYKENTIKSPQLYYNMDIATQELMEKLINL